jgi:NAD-dependent oxidoreductase involved in siderophore biosynthesis
MLVSDINNGSGSSRTTALACSLGVEVVVAVADVVAVVNVVADAVPLTVAEANGNGFPKLAAISCKM